MGNKAQKAETKLKKHTGRKHKASWWWVVPSGVLEPNDQRGQGFTGIRLQTGSLQPKNVPRVSILENGIYFCGKAKELKLIP